MKNETEPKKLLVNVELMVKATSKTIKLTKC